MKAHKKIILSSFTSMVFLISILMFAVSPVMALSSQDSLVWEAQIPNSGADVVSPILERGEYRIVAEEIWWYNQTGNLAADAQYYTTDNSSSWNWGNYFPAPAGHSFLQINSEDVDWGPFSNGDSGHTYTIYYTAVSAASITFRIVDWMDTNYANNDCYILVRIYKVVTVGGYVVDSNPSETFTWIIGALMMAMVITVPIIKYRRKNHCRTG